MEDRSMEFSMEGSTDRPSPKIRGFDDHMMSCQNGPRDDLDWKSDSSTFFNFDGGFAASSNFFRPPVWTGAGNAADGLLGCQAPAADGLDETFAVHPPERQPQPTLKPASLPKAKGTKAAPPPPPFPIEIHLQVLSHLLSSSELHSCSFCHLFELSTLSKVSILYNSLLQPHLYGVLNLNFNSSLNANASLTHHRDQRQICGAHLALGSKHKQLETRIPLLLRTLSARPDIARAVRKIVLPPGGMATYLTCSLEKTLLPQLIQCCPNLQSVSGVDKLLSRQFFSSEHYCFDGQDPQQHGVFAKALHETKTLRHWAWNGGSAAGRDFSNHVWDRNPAMEDVCFIAYHRNWRALEHLEIRDVWNLDAAMLARLIPTLPALRKIALVGVRKKRRGRGEADSILSALDQIPSSIKDVEIGNTADEGFLTAVGEWVRVRHTIKDFGMLESLRIVQTPVTVEGLEAFFTAISVQEVSGYERLYTPLLDFRPRWKSAVKRLAIDNEGFEDLFRGYGASVGNMELAGLEELQWEVHGNWVAYLPERLQRGWFGDLKHLAADRDSVLAARERGIEAVEEF